MDSIQNPIGKLAAWHKNTTTPPKPEVPSYEGTVQDFNGDLALLQKHDRDSNSAPLPRFPFSLFENTKKDTDPRPGEVEVKGVGSLHSTPEGFSLRAISESWVHHRAAGGSVKFGALSRSYEVNEDKGTISVVKKRQPGFETRTHEKHGWSRSDTPGYTESYTIDTNDGSVKDYRKVNLGEKPDRNSSGLFAR